MRAVVLEEYGGVEVLQVRDVPDPVPGPDQVVVDVVSTALNRADLLQRQGLYPGPPMVHEIPGMEFAGVVRSVGSEVTAAAVGDEVMGIVGGGSYAEQVVTHERLLLPVPTSVSLEDAAAIPEVFITAFDALVVQGGLTRGRSALVHAGASGVGTAAIQIARAMGAEVIVTTSTAKVQACTDLGADVVIDYTESDFVDVVRSSTSRRGVDVIVDVVGGEYTARNVSCIAPQGRIIQVGVMGGPTCEFPIALLMVKRAQLIGTTLRMRPIEEKILTCSRFRTEMSPAFDAGLLRPVIDRRFRLDEIAAAHDYLATNQSIGKVVLGVSAP